MTLGIEAFRGADVLTREAAVTEVKAAVLRNSVGMMGAGELVRTALVALYQQDFSMTSPTSKLPCSKRCSSTSRAGRMAIDGAARPLFGRSRPNDAAARNRAREDKNTQQCFISKAE
jgi:hypothetical protein